MKTKRLSIKEKKNINSDFTTILTFCLVSHTKGLSFEEKLDIKNCLKEKKMAKALKIIEKKYSPRDWKAFVETHAAPIMRSYS